MNKLAAILVALLLAGIILFTFWDLPKTFFQQDEWWAFGTILASQDNRNLLQTLLYATAASSKVHVNPLTDLGFYVQFHFFGLSFPGYAMVSMVLHFANTLLVYTLVRRLTRNNYVSVLSALLFSVNSISHQAVSWVATSLNVQGSTLFSLLSAIVFFRYLAQGKRRGILLYVSYVCVFVALLFKETALPFFLLPTLFMIEAKDKSVKNTKKVFLPFGLFTLVYLSVRVGIWFRAPSIIYGVSDALVQPSLFVFAYRFFTISFKAVTEGFVPMHILLNGSRLLIRLAYPHLVASDGAPNPYLVEYAGLDLVIYIVSAIIFVLIYRSYQGFVRARKKDFANAIFISLVIMVASTLLVIFIPGKAGYVSIIEPRHLYGATIGASMLTVLILYSFIFRIKHPVAKYILLTLPLLVIVLFHIRLIQKDMALLYERSKLRKSFLETIERKYETLPQRVVFYVQSDTSYYGMPDEVKILPVQSGFGRMLMVWYQKKEHFPRCLYKDAFLHGIDEQGYRYCDGRGVGYYRQYQVLLSTLREQAIAPESLIAYQWHSETMQFRDITGQLRKTVDNDLNRL